MVDWVIVASLATAAGTLVLAVATFASVRTAERAARAAERALLVGMRPVLMPSRLSDEAQKITWGDRRLTRVAGGRGLAEVVDDIVYLAMSVRNAGTGIAVLHGWRPSAAFLQGDDAHGDPADFRRQTRDLYVPAGDLSFWQGAVRTNHDPEHASLVAAIKEREMVTVELLYSDHDGGQRMISRFALSPLPSDPDGPDWLCIVTRHWNLDRADPR
jgi:hypothetical protein